MPRVMRFGFLICLVTLAALQGCATNRESASVSPDVDLSQLKKFYVVKFASDGRGINNLIANELRKRGLEAPTGPEDSAPKDANAIVTYQDRWQWDVTMYMLELRIFVREPRTNSLLAVGNSHHTSLSRRSPEEMVAEVLSNIFREATKSPQPGR